MTHSRVAAIFPAVIFSLLLPLTSSAFPPRGVYAELYPRLLEQMIQSPGAAYRIIDRTRWEFDENAETRMYAVLLDFEEKGGCPLNTARAQVIWRGELPEYSFELLKCVAPGDDRNLRRPARPVERGYAFVTDAYFFGLEYLSRNAGFIRFLDVTAQNSKSSSKILFTYSTESGNTCFAKSDCFDIGYDSTDCSNKLLPCKN
jgi:hypothetical protein